jgi:hypothetical protein
MNGARLSWKWKMRETLARSVSNNISHPGKVKNMISKNEQRNNQNEPLAFVPPFLRYRKAERI